ncbi:hypothetical protein [Acrocarpospora catenulata]|uniref:hypothetical protein n=1 Tax=Acrocarpospora catenulata TaxID=2836182 RepID=UPI001BD9B544|nr:hypothetical protein [Acrocarpospora catenulata]
MDIHDIHDVDDLPFHQHPTPLNYPATSDVHFNDGYYFGMFGSGLYVSCGLRLHPNMNVMDGWAGYARDGVQTTVRLSRALRPAYSELRLGPLSVEITRPMKELTLRLQESVIGLAFDVTLHAQAAPFLEQPHQHRKYGHLINDVVRYSQHCAATGHVEIDGERTEVDGWLAVRDHSWGIRSAMGPKTWHGGLTERAGHEADERRFRLWVHFDIGGSIGFFHTHEGETGDTLDFDGALTSPDGTTVRLTALRHRLAYFDGTRNISGGEIALLDERGNWHEYRIELDGTPVDLQGFGYHSGWSDGGSAGVYRSGVLHTEQDSYPADPKLGRTGPPHLDVRKRLGPIEYPCRLVAADGATGRAHVEHHLLGRFEPYLAASLTP